PAFLPEHSLSLRSARQRINQPILRGSSHPSAFVHPPGETAISPRQRTQIMHDAMLPLECVLHYTIGTRTVGEVRIGNWGVGSADDSASVVDDTGFEKLKNAVGTAECAK